MAGSLAYDTLQIPMQVTATGRFPKFSFKIDNGADDFFHNVQKFAKIISFNHIDPRRAWH